METTGADRDLNILNEILCRMLNRQEVSADVDIYQAGLTSIMVLPLLAELEEAFHVAIPDSDFLDARTPRDLVHMIGRIRNAQSSN
jgi:acyl carrier protein